VNSGRNQDLGREGLATAEKPGTKSQKLGRRASETRVAAAPDRRSRKPLLIEIEWPPLRLSHVGRSAACLSARSPPRLKSRARRAVGRTPSRASPDSRELSSRRHVRGAEPVARPFAQLRTRIAWANRSRASCTGGGPWESITKFLWLFMSPRRSTPSRSRKAAGVGKSDFLAMSKTLRGSNARSGDWRIGTTGCRSALKPGRWIRALSPGRGARPRLYGGRSGLISETFGRAHQDEPARRGHAGATATGRRVDT
jgi:hypothetical protein